MTQQRWLMIALAFFAIIITYMDRTALSYAIVPIEENFKLNNADFGMIAAAFGFGYIVMSVGGGVLVDKYGSRRIWSLFAVLWSVASALMALVTGFYYLFFLRVLLGLTEGPSFPSFKRVVTDWLPISERARGLAIGLAAVPLASVIGSPFISYLIAAFGWRAMFVILGISGIVWAFIWYCVFRDQPSQDKKMSAAELLYIQKELEISPQLIKPKTTWRYLLNNRALIINNYAFFSFGYLLFFAINWLPGYLQQSYGINVKQVGWFLVIPWGTAAVLMVLGGIISDWVWKKTYRIRLARSYLIAICQFLSAIFFIPAALSHSLPMAIVFLSLGLGFGMMPNAALYAINGDLAHDRAATSLGIMICCSSVASILSPFLTGWLSHLTGNFVAAISLLVGFSFSSALIVFLFQHPDSK